MELNNELEKLLVKNKDNKLAHSNLIITNNIDKCVSELTYVIKNILCSDTFSYECQKCNICHLIDEQSLMNFLIIEPDGMFIKKEQVDNLLDKFKLKPELVSKNIYIIKNAEKLTKFSGNPILKFIEDPLENTIGFLVTNNINAILPTIVSRCQITKVNYEEEQQTNLEIIDLANDFIYNIENNFDEILFFIKDNILIKEYAKQDYIALFNEIFDIYYNILLKKLNQQILDDKYSYLASIKIAKVKTKLKVITDYLNRLNYNVDINLFLDSFAYEMRC